PVTIGARRGPVGTAAWDGIHISELFDDVRREGASGPGPEPLLVEDLGDAAVGGIGRQAAQAGERGGVGPTRVAGAPVTRDAQDGTGFRLPADRHLDRRVAPVEADVFDQV